MDQNSTLATLFFIAVIMLVVLAVFLWNKWKHRQWLDSRLRGSWGKVPDRE